MKLNLICENTSVEAIFGAIRKMLAKNPDLTIHNIPAAKLLSKTPEAELFAKRLQQNIMSSHDPSTAIADAAKYVAAAKEVTNTKAFADVKQAIGVYAARGGLNRQAFEGNLIRIARMRPDLVEQWDKLVKTNPENVGKLIAAWKNQGLWVNPKPRKVNHGRNPAWATSSSTPCRLYMD